MEVMLAGTPTLFSVNPENRIWQQRICVVDNTLGAVRESAQITTV
jgi:hypothetical protein